MHTTRRDFVKASAAAAAGVALLSKSASAAQSAPSQSAPSTLTDQSPTRDTTLKFGPDGAVRPFAGNTVICHLPVQCAMRDVMAEFHEKLKTSSYKDRLGLTTVDSYHMTIFPGANDQGRQATGWPSYVPLNATIEECNAAVGQRMRRAQLHCHLPIRVAVDLPSTLSYPRACTLRMKAIDAAEEMKLRAVRDQLSQLYGFRLPDHSSYVFHITMSYQVAAFDNLQAKEFLALRADYVRRIVEAQPVLELGNPEYCTFRDMFRFEPKILLNCVE